MYLPSTKVPSSTIKHKKVGDSKRKYDELLKNMNQARKFFVIFIDYYFQNLISDGDDLYMSNYSQYNST